MSAGALEAIVAPLASATVTTIVGFTEVDDAGQLYNAAAVCQRGAVVGRYRKRHPAIRTSRYAAGTEAPLFTVDALTFGILICRDSLDADLARGMVQRGAAALLVPTNNAMPASRGGSELVTEARELDGRRATELGAHVIRADVVGETRHLVSHGASAIVDRSGSLLSAPQPGCADLLVANIDLR
jgi:predicted amidohydrolase